MKTGQGKETCPDGSYYQGKIFSEYFFNFLGGFKNDMKEGEGVWVFADGSEVTGYFIGDNLSEGSFKSKTTGNTYKGSFKQFRKHGKGVLKFKDGRKYEGDFREGKIDGYGMLFSKPNEEGKCKTWKGQFIDGYIDGVVTYTSIDGSQKRGLWDKGKRIKWLNDKEN